MTTPSGSICCSRRAVHQSWPTVICQDRTPTPTCHKLARISPSVKSAVHAPRSRQSVGERHETIHYCAAAASGTAVAAVAAIAVVVSTVAVSAVAVSAVAASAAETSAAETSAGLKPLQAEIMLTWPPPSSGNFKAMELRTPAMVRLLLPSPPAMTCLPPPPRRR